MRVNPVFFFTIKIFFSKDEADRNASISHNVNVGFEIYIVFFLSLYGHLAVQNGILKYVDCRHNTIQTKLLREILDYVRTVQSCFLKITSVWFPITAIVYMGYIIGSFERTSAGSVP